jgi:hypothetical protein
MTIPSKFGSNCATGSRQDEDGRHSAVALLLKAALIQVSDYRLLGASGFIYRYLCNFTRFLFYIWTIQ